MLTLCPSHQRAGEVLTRKWLPEAVLCVNESQVAAYEAAEGGEVWGMPDAIGGNMARVRNWMVEEAFKRDDEVCMVDDDVYRFGVYDAGRERVLDAADFARFAAQGFRMAGEIGARLWGVNVQADPMFYMAFTPLNLNVPVLGTMTFLSKNPLRYDERLGLNEDYDMTLQHIAKYRVVLRFDKYHYWAKHLTESKSGGCSAYRTLDEERRQADIMLAKWGRKVVRYNLKRSTNPILSSPV